VAQTVRGLGKLGFGKGEARDTLHATRAHVGSDDIESWMRTALERLKRNSWEKAS
jgi:hypothetical protein